MKTLYFDLDGTLVRSSFGDVKPRLADGVFEKHVRQAGFERLVCVGNATGIVHMLEEEGKEVDGHEIIYRLAFGAFADLEWFRLVMVLVADPDRRAAHIDYSGDWWWVDDLAATYLQREGLSKMLKGHIGRRICVPSPDGDGQDVIDWLDHRTSERP